MNHVVNFETKFQQRICFFTSLNTLEKRINQLISGTWRALNAPTLALKKKITRYKQGYKNPINIFMRLFGVKVEERLQRALQLQKSLEDKKVEHLQTRLQSVLPSDLSSSSKEIAAALQKAISSNISTHSFVKVEGHKGRAKAEQNNLTYIRRVLKIGEGVYGEVQKELLVTLDLSKDVMTTTIKAVKKTATRRTLPERMANAERDLKNTIAIAGEIHRKGPVPGIIPTPQGAYFYARKMGNHPTKQDHFVYFDACYLSNLEKPIESFTSLEVGKKEEALLETLRGMAYVHSLDIVHSDIKPENMYWTDENKVVLGDLGGAKKLQVGWSDALAGETNYYGAPVSSGYINTKDDVALREAFQKRDFDRWSLLKKKADVFALGLSFAEIFLGQDALRKLLNDTTMRANVTPPEKFQQQLCEALSKVGASNEARGAILSMLNVDPDQRVTMQEALKLWKK